MFKVYQYNVQVAFIQSVIDPSHPPVYCESLLEATRIDVNAPINSINISMA
jgi:hypothetical protein